MSKIPPPKSATKAAASSTASSHAQASTTAAASTATATPTPSAATSGSAPSPSSSSLASRISNGLSAASKLIRGKNDKEKDPKISATTVATPTSAKASASKSPQSQQQQQHQAEPKKPVTPNPSFPQNTPPKAEPPKTSNAAKTAQIVADTSSQQGDEGATDTTQHARSDTASTQYGADEFEQGTEGQPSPVASSVGGSSFAFGPGHSSEGGNVCVVVRMRPLNQMERRSGQSDAWSIRDEQVIFQTFLPSDRYGSNAVLGRLDDDDKGSGVSGVSSGSLTSKQKVVKPLSFLFDVVYGGEVRNDQIFDQIGAALIHSSMNGFHGTIFAYGQTSSGKTHSIHGSGHDPGMIPLGVRSIFHLIEHDAEMSAREFVLRVSYIEVYNELVHDLLNPLSANLSIREDKKTGVYVEGLKEEVVVSAEHVFTLLAQGENLRHVGRTNYNEVSSRSHTIFRLTIESTQGIATSADDSKSKKNAVRISTLNLVDLAGSENAVKAGSAARAKETGYINKSLLTLGHVIFKLSERATAPNTVNASHIPYRDSKLTRILQNALDGRSLVAVVACISPSSGNLEETISTLKFASRAKKVKHHAAVNEVFDESALLTQYRQEIDRLKRELQKARDYNTMLAQQALNSSSADKKVQAENGTKDGNTNTNTARDSASLSSSSSSGSIGDQSDEGRAQDTEDLTVALATQIDQLTRLILRSNKTTEPKDNETDSAAVYTPHTQPHITHSRTPSMQARGSFALQLANTSNAALFKEEHSITAPSIHHEREDSDAGNMTATNSGSNERASNGAAAANVSSSQSGVRSQSSASVYAAAAATAGGGSAAGLTRQSSSSTGGSSYEDLQRRVEESDQALSEWDSWFAVYRNKQSLLHSRLEELVKKELKKQQSRSSKPRDEDVDRLELFLLLGEALEAAHIIDPVIEPNRQYLPVNAEETA